jgi:hypothetical protein
VTLRRFSCQLQHVVDGCSALAAIRGALAGDRHSTRITLGCVGFRGFWRCRRLSHDTMAISSRSDSSIYERFAGQLARCADFDRSLSILRAANSAPLESVRPPSSMTNKPRPSEVYGLRCTRRVSHAKACADMALFVFSGSTVPESFPSDRLYVHGMHQG